MSLYHDARLAMTEAVNEELVFQSPENRQVFYGWLLDLRIQKRIYYLNTAMAADVLWATLRPDEELLDLVMRISVGFHLRLGNATQPWAGLMAASISGLTVANKSSVTDEAFSEKIPAKPALERLLTEEYWLLSVVTMERFLSDLIPLEHRTGTTK